MSVSFAKAVVHSFEQDLLAIVLAFILVFSLWGVTCVVGDLRNGGRSLSFSDDFRDGLVYTVPAALFAVVMVAVYNWADTVANCL